MAGQHEWTESDLEKLSDALQADEDARTTLTEEEKSIVAKVDAFLNRCGGDVDPNLIEAEVPGATAVYKKLSETHSMFFRGLRDSRRRGI